MLPVNLPARNDALKTGRITMAKTRGFPLEHFTSQPAGTKQAPAQVEKSAEAVRDSGTVKIGEGGGMPFRRPETEDTGKVKIGEGGGAPFRRPATDDTGKVKIGAGGGAPFTRL